MYNPNLTATPLPKNQFSWMYSAAARAGYPPDQLLRPWRPELVPNLKPNRLVSFGGLCSDSLGAAAFIHDLLMHSQEGFVRVFPSWPANASAAFSTLRARGAFLVSGAYEGKPGWAGLVAGRTGGTANVTIFAEAGGAARGLSPWPAPTTASSVVDTTTSSPAALTWSTVGGKAGGPVVQWTTARGHTYVMTCAGASCTV